MVKRDTPKVIDFYYEFSSPYGYFAAVTIEEVAAKHGAIIKWHPFLLGTVFKEVGTKPLSEYPMKGEYSIKDMYRTARLFDIPFTMPNKFPFLAVKACRLVLWISGADEDKRAEISKAIYKACYQDQRKISERDVLMGVAEDLGYDPREAIAGIETEEIKQQLKQEVEAGKKAGVFGSPFFIIANEAFWGFDRLHQLDKWLESGGW